MPRDRLVVGIQDLTLSEKLQTDHESGGKAGLVGLRRLITDRITTEEEPTNVRGVAVTNTILEIGVQP